MTDKEIVEKLLVRCPSPKKIVVDKMFFIEVDSCGNLVYQREDGRSYEVPYELFIFRHKFAKAFWGTEKVDDFGKIVKFATLEQYNKAYPNGERPLCAAHSLVSQDSTWYTNQDYEHMQRAWEYHLQQMVLEENPLKYLEKFL